MYTYIRTILSRLERRVRIWLRRIFYKENRYTAMQKVTYADGTSNHLEHNENKEYFSVLLRQIADDRDSWKGKMALDFGCGKGRNVRNLLRLADWGGVDGIDISEDNIDYCSEEFKVCKEPKECRFFLASGTDLRPIKSNHYDFVMSTIVLQHIPVYNIRRSILTDILRCMKPGAIFSFQMGYGDDMIDCAGVVMAGYYDNFYDASGTNSDCDVQITDGAYIVSDLNAIGFTNVEHVIRPSFSDSKHKYWLYVKCQKPIILLS